MVGIMANITDATTTVPPLGTIGWYQASSTAVPPEYDDGLNLARTNLDRTITALSQKLEDGRETISIEDISIMAKAIKDLVDARLEMDR